MPYGISVELRPNIGIASDPFLGEIRVEHNQWEVWVDSKQIKMNYGVSPVRIGFAPKKGGTVEFEIHARKWPKDAQQFIADEVGRLTDTERKPIVPYAPDPPQVEDLDEVDVTDLDELEE